MNELKVLVKEMMDDMRKDLIKDGDYDVDGINGIDEDGIKIAVYEDLNDTLKVMFSDVLYK